MKTVFVYTVIAGDTLSEIAAAISASAGITWEAIEAANEELDPRQLTIGHVILVPAINGGNSVLKYTIRESDTLSGIANALAQCGGLKYQQIVQNNENLVADDIKIGQQINIPAVVNTEEKPVSQIRAMVKADNVGYWDWTWSDPSRKIALSDVTISLAFSGWTDVRNALQQSEKVKDSLVGEKYICLGGGNARGSFNRASIQAVTAAIDDGEFDGYDGIAYDVEEGDSGLKGDFAASFLAAKEKGFKVFVTVSHSAPYGISDASSLMQVFFEDGNIDFISPQLYTTGSETQNDYATSHGVSWKDYAHCKAAVVPMSSMIWA